MSSLSRLITSESGFPATLTVLVKQHHDYMLKVRSVTMETADKEMFYLKRFFDYFGPPDSPADLFAAICPATVTGFLAWYASRYGPGSRRWMQITLRVFLRFASQSGYLESDLSELSPSVRIYRMGKITRSIPPECIDAVISAIGHDTPADLRDSSIICLLSTYGVRGVQIRRLCLEDIDWTNSRINFPAAKGGRPVEQHLTARAGNCLADYISNGRPSSSCREVFLTLKEPFIPISQPCQLSLIIRKRIKQAGVELPEGVSYGSHSFRHAFASRLYGRVPFKDIVDMLGHRNPSTTLIYGKVDIPTLRKAALPWPGGEQ
jgi:integrase